MGDPRLPEGKYGRWSEHEFFRHGAERVDEFLTHGAVHRPLGHQDGAGLRLRRRRLTRPLAAHFEQVTGLDISETMIERARDSTPASPTSSSRATPGPTSDVRRRDVRSRRLRHRAPAPARRATVQGYLAEFVRVLRPGGLLVFQLPTSLPLAVRIQPRRSAYRVDAAGGAAGSHAVLAAGAASEPDAGGAQLRA